jgi:hypothetical protein
MLIPIQHYIRYLVENGLLIFNKKIVIAIFLLYQDN